MVRRLCCDAGQTISIEETVSAMALRGDRRRATARRPTTVLASLVACVALLAAGCAGNSSSSSSSEIVIGASIPLSGPLAGFGSFQRWGYQHAVDEANQAGGVQVGGAKRKVRLVLLDDKTDPNTTSANTDTLITRNQATALLGSCTPALVNAGGVVADRNRVPMVTGCAPLEAFKSVKQWQYVWDVFFDEPDLAEAPFKTLAAAGVETNKKVAIVHDNGPDGAVVGGQLWPALAQQTGQTYSQHIADSYAAARILLDAISAAGSTDKARINTAIGRTDKTYVVGPVKFDDRHTSKLPIAELQWQGGQTKVVWPPNRATGSLLFPAPGSGA